MRMDKYFQSVIYILVLCRGLESSNTSASTSSEVSRMPSSSEPKVSEKTTSSFIKASTIISSEVPRMSEPTVNALEQSGSGKTTSSFIKKTSSSSTVTENNSNITSNSNYSTSSSISILSTTQTTDLIPLTASSNTANMGKYSSRVRMKCSFLNDVFLPDYSIHKSNVLMSYLRKIFAKLHDTLQRRTLELIQMLVYSVEKGSVVVDMELYLVSVNDISDKILEQNVRKATIEAFPGNVVILQIKTSQSSQLINESKFWIIGIVLASVLAIILIIITLLVFFRYFPNACCKKRVVENPTNTRQEYMVEMEYDVAYNDNSEILDRNPEKVGRFHVV